MKVSATIENITVEKANKLLEKNVDNQRVVKHAHVAYLAEQMRQKKWSPTANTISIADDGTLINGQHRLLAVIKFGSAIKMLVLRGQPRSDFHFIDTDIKSRSAEDHAYIEGREDPANLVPLMRWLFNATANKMSDPNVTPGPHIRLSPYELQRWGYEHHYPQLAEARSKIKEMGKLPSFLRLKVISFAYYTAVSVDAELADKFFSYLITGISDSECRTMVLLRNNINDEMFKLVSAGANMRSICEKILPIITHGWMLMRGKQTRRSRIFWGTNDKQVGYKFV